MQGTVWKKVTRNYVGKDTGEAKTWRELVILTAPPQRPEDGVEGGEALTFYPRFDISDLHFGDTVELEIELRAGKNGPYSQLVGVKVIKRKSESLS